MLSVQCCSYLSGVLTPALAMCFKKRRGLVGKSSKEQGNDERSEKHSLQVVILFHLKRKMLVQLSVSLREEQSIIESQNDLG